MARFWKIVAVLAIICYPLFWGIVIEALNYPIEALFGGFAWPSLLLSFVETVAMVSIIISLLTIYKKRFDNQGRLGRWMSPNAYGSYIFHVIIIYALMTPLYGRPIPSILKFFLVLVIAVPGTYIFTSIIRKIPGVKRILG